MSVSQTMHDAKWTMAECHLIAQTAVSRFVDVEAWQVLEHLDIWRQWFYGMLPTTAVLSLSGVRPTDVSGR